MLPLLENMGVRVTDERPVRDPAADGQPVWIYDFGLQHDEGAEFQADDVRETFQDAFARIGAARPRTTASTGSSSRRG